MATSYAHRIAFNEARNASKTLAADGTLAARMLSWMRQFYCGLHGHDSLIHFEKERLSMQCASCGHETPGWELTETPPKVVLRGDSRRHQLVRPRLIAERRIA